WKIPRPNDPTKWAKAIRVELDCLDRRGRSVGGLSLSARSGIDRLSAQDTRKWKAYVERILLAATGWCLRGRRRLTARDAEALQDLAAHLFRSTSEQKARDTLPKNLSRYWPADKVLSAVKRPSETAR